MNGNESTIVCTHDGSEHVWEPGAGCPDAIRAGSWSVRSTAPLPPDPADVLTRLEELHQAATPGPWRVDAKGWIDAGKYDTVIGPADVDCMSYCYGGTSRIEGDNLPADAAAIVAEHNAIGPLIEIVREFWNEHDGRTCCDRTGGSFLGNELCATRQMIADLLAPSAIAATLGETGGGQ